MKVGHLAVYTDNMEKSVAFYKLLGAKEGDRSLLDIGGGRTKDLFHMVFDGEVTVELIEPSDHSMIPRGVGIGEHFCFVVDDVDAKVAELRALGIDSFDREAPSEKPIFGGVKLIFFTGPNGELIELLQEHL